MKTLYLHCGTHKTGTTSIQVDLGEREEFLRQVGLLVPKTGRFEDSVGAHHNLAWELSRDRRYNPVRGTIHNLMDELSRTPHSAAILSSEDFECCLSESPERFRWFIRCMHDAGYFVNVIVFLREKAEYAASLYGELRKIVGGLSPEDFANQILEKGGYSPGPPYTYFFDFNYRRMIGRYKEALRGCGTVSVRRYEREVVGRFFDLIGLPLDAVSRSIRANSSGCPPCDGTERVLERISGRLDDDALFLEEEGTATGGFGDEDPIRFAAAFGFVPKRTTEVNAWHGHIPFAAWIMHALKPRVFVELGTHRGDSYSAFCQAVLRFQLPVRCYAIDTWCGDEHAGFYGEDIYNDFRAYHDEIYGSFSTLLRKTFDEALAEFVDGSVDMLHIDGAHGYEIVRHDFETWLPKMSERGVILFHDTAVTERDFGVWKFWQEVEGWKPSFQFFHSHGLGVLAVGRKIDPALARLCGTSERQAVKIRQLFAEQASLIAAEASRGRIQAQAEQAQAQAELAKREVERIGAELSERSERIAELNQAVTERAHALHEMRASRSWRVTRPLRYIGRSARRCLSAFRRSARIVKVIAFVIGNVPAAVSRWGLAGLLLRSIKIYREERLEGIVRRVDAFVTMRTQESSRVQSSGGEGLSSVDDKRLPAVPQRSAYKISYIVNSSDFMTQVYRVVNYSEALARYGHECMILRARDISKDTDINSDILVLNRISWSAEVEFLVERFKAMGRPVFYDIDDLVFDPHQIAKLRHTSCYSEQEKTNLLHFMEGAKKIMLLCDAVTVSTFALKVEVEKRGKPAYVLPNSIGNQPLELAKSLAKRSPSVTAPQGRVRVAYLSGTKTHQRDFLECSDAVLKVLSERSRVELLIVGHLDLPLQFEVLRGQVIRKPLMPYQDMLKELATVDVVLVPLELGNNFTDCKSELKVFEAAMFGIPVVASPTSTISAIIDHGKTGYMAASPEEWFEALTKLLGDPALRMRLGEAARKEIARRYVNDMVVLEADKIYRAALARQLRTVRPQDTRAICGDDAPKVTVISVLYRKAREVRYFLEALRRQDFPGRFEVLFVDDRSPDDSVRVVENFKKWMSYAAQEDRRMDIRILTNKRNMGNCASRNAAVLEAQGDIIMVVDADCMLNRSCLSLHYEALSTDRYDAAVGPMNIETNCEPPMAVLNRYEASAILGLDEDVPQDPINPDSFVNCVTRNFSIRRGFLRNRLDGKLFDEAFSYSAAPESGFGWEDVEMGYRIFAAGGRIRYLPDTVSIHVSHDSSTPESEKPVRSLRNYRRLFEKHPDILYVSRPWAIRTWEAIVAWAESVGARLDDNADYCWLERRFRRYQQAPIILDRSRKLKVLTYCWHVPHQYELFKLGHMFVLVSGTGTAMCDSWKFDKRPLPHNCEIMPIDRLDIGDFDVAILHFDENVLRPDLCCGKVPDDWGRTFRWFINNVDLPKIGVCHGTPQFKGQYDLSYKNADLGETIAENREELVRLLGGIPVVCNSHQACHEWGFADSVAIWHGFSPHEYSTGTYERGVLTMTREALTNRPHYNGLLINDRVRELVGGAVPFEYLKVPEPARMCKGEAQEWGRVKYQNYRETLSHYSIYFNSTQRSPMPRSRGEAMMAGLVSVSLRNHDVDLFVRNGVNGFFSDVPEELAEQIRFLGRNDASRRKMMAASRQTALDLFNHDRYLAKWSALLKRVVG